MLPQLVRVMQRDTDRKVGLMTMSTRAAKSMCLIEPSCVLASGAVVTGVMMIDLDIILKSLRH